jgi:hypothetical protein
MLCIRASCPARRRRATAITAPDYRIDAPLALCNSKTQTCPQIIAGLGGSNAPIVLYPRAAGDCSAVQEPRRWQASADQQKWSTPPRGAPVRRRLARAMAIIHPSAARPSARWRRDHGTATGRGGDPDLGEVVVLQKGLGRTAWGQITASERQRGAEAPERKPWERPNDGGMAMAWHGGDPASSPSRAGQWLGRRSAAKDTTVRVRSMAFPCLEFFFLSCSFSFDT